MIFNNFKQFERAKIFVKPQYNSYLGAFEGRIRKVYKKNGRYFADVLMYLSDGDYTFALRTENIFLKNPDLYPKLPTLPENTYKRGGGNKMIRMPRLFAWLMWLAVVVLVWHGVTHIDQIANFFVHLVLHR